MKSNLVERKQTRMTTSNIVKYNLFVCMYYVVLLISLKLLNRLLNNLKKYLALVYVYYNIHILANTPPKGL